MIDVVVVVGVRLYREALVRVLREQLDIDVAGEAATAEGALVEVSRARPHVTLVDLDVEGAIGTVRAASSGTHFVAIGFSGDERDAVVAAEAGVSGYVGVHQPLADVSAAIRGVMNGEAPCDGRIAAMLLRRVEAAAREASSPSLAQLTMRERRVLELLASGLSNKEIAAELIIGVATVKSHVHAILHKLDVNGRWAAAEVFRRAVVAGARPQVLRN